MKALLIEDDDRARDILGRALRREFPGVLVENIECVSDFVAQFEALAADPPDVVLLDIMMPWRTNGPQEPEVEDGHDSLPEFDFFRSGVGVLKMLSEDPRTCRVPVIILSSAYERILQEGVKLPTHVLGFTKPVPFRELFEAIKSMTFGQFREARPSLGTSLAETVEAKVGWFGVSFDLKKLVAIFDERHRH